jgi:hypothetical protein
MLMLTLFLAARIAIEQDLAWHTDALTGKSWSVLSHEAHTTGNEPTLQSYFFERIRPIVEDALKRSEPRTWPLITLNLDFKTEEPEHLRAVWLLLKQYESWLTTAERSPRADDVRQLDVKPVLVLTGESDAQEPVFHDAVPIGNRLIVFGATHPERPVETNYRAGGTIHGVSSRKAGRHMRANGRRPTMNVSKLWSIERIGSDSGSVFIR